MTIPRQKHYKIPIKALVFLGLTINFIVAIFSIHLIPLEPGVTEMIINGVATPATEESLHMVRLILTILFTVFGSVFAYLFGVTLWQSRLQNNDHCEGV